MYLSDYENVGLEIFKSIMIFGCFGGCLFYGVWMIVMGSSFNIVSSGVVSDIIVFGEYYFFFVSMVFIVFYFFC